MNNTNIIRVGRYLTTEGLNATIGFEFSLLVQDHEEPVYIELLDHLINYVIVSTPSIKADQTIAFHSWLLKFVLAKPNYLNIHEVQNDGGRFIEGADHAINIVKEQIKLCKNYGSDPLFPTFSQMIVVSKGVLDGKNIDAVRYPSPNHMTGWWLTTELYDGDVSSLETIHYYHVAFSRPDIIKWLALPFGFRFISGEKPEIWFDNEVLS